MKRLATLFGAIVIVAAVAAPAVLAAEPEFPHTGRVLMAFGGDIDVPAGQQADVVIVGQGDALISGTVNAIVVMDGTATLRDATVESVFIFGGSVALEGNTVVTGDVRSIESTVHRGETAVVEGAVKGLDTELLMVGAVLVPALFLLAVGFAVATLVAGLLLVAIGTRQVRAAERLIVREPGWVFVIGLLAAIVTPIAAVIGIVTIVGAPLGFAVLVAVMPTLAFIGFLVAGIFLGERILGTNNEIGANGRPYKAALVGIIVLQAIGLIPGIGGLVTGIASLFGLGALVLLGWRTIRGEGPGDSVTTRAPMPIGA